MSLKTATFIAIIGTSVQLVVSVLVWLGYQYRLILLNPILLSTMGWLISQVSLLIFFVVLFLKQRKGE